MRQRNSRRKRQRLASSFAIRAACHETGATPSSHTFDRNIAETVDAQIVVAAVLKNLHGR
jgi:hypothetical protein